jgi:hypothetical protein
MPENTQTTLRIAVAQSTVHEDPTSAALLRESGAEVRGLMKQAADAGARLVHFTEGAICFPSKRVMSERGPDEIGPSDWRKAQWTVLKEELDRIAALSGELRIWTVIPSVHQLAAPNRPHNSMYVVSDQGKVVARYDERMLSTTKITWMYTPGKEPVTFEHRNRRPLLGRSVLRPRLPLSRCRPRRPDAPEAVRRYKLGVTEDVWRKIDRAKLEGAEAYVQARVRGQDHAVQHMLDIVKRAATGIGGKRGGRPRGVAFLAGPTGVGKTELAKTITSLLFGDESAYIRFDMSEFSAEHADQRLIGAPPGYIGYDTGGELTNAIRQRPFSVVLFDEIEKAHPRILDKFLQILDDGVLTSGRGERVYFSESLIVFTSNLGMTRTLQDGSRVANVTPGEPLDEVRRKVRHEIERHFKLEISRPEILNRIGENVIVFDFIRPQVAREILELMVTRVIEDVRVEQQLALSFTPQASARLEALCLGDLSNGGRGIRNQVEVHLVNPLARALFALDPRPGVKVTIADVASERGITTLTLAS